MILTVIGYMVLAQKQPRLTMAGTVYDYEVATTPAEQQQGLSGRENLPANHAMLFVFSADGQDCFWMKDMHFPLDIIWLSSQKQVVTIKENALPSSYPESFCPNQPARYVVEANAGTVSKTGLKLGDKVRF